MNIVQLNAVKKQVLDFALEYLERGFSVMPLHSIVAGQCSCKKEDCGKPGKHSPIRWKEFQKRLPTEAEVRNWWRRWPYANVGIVTGAISGLFVLDVDGTDGIKSIKRFDIPMTVTANTGGGGEHVFFKYASDKKIGNRTGVRRNLDIRGDGGYVVAPPSIHSSGKGYSWQDGKSPGECELAEAPDWLIEMLFPQVRDEITTSIPEKKLLPCALNFIKSGTTEGTRDTFLFTLAKHARGASMLEVKALSLLQRANEVCKPPLPDNIIEEKIQSAYYGNGGDGYSSLGCDEDSWKIFCSDDCPVKTKSWPEPEPILFQLPVVEPLSPALIPEPFREWLLDISHRMQCPLDFVASGATVIAGAIVGAACGIRPKRNDDWLVIPNLWGAVVARPSMLKTPSLAEVIKPLTLMEVEAKDFYESQMNLHIAEMEYHKAKREALRAEMLNAAKGKMKNGAPAPNIDDVKKRFSELVEAVAPTRRRLKTNDATVEKLSELLNENPRGILLFRDELIGLLVSWDKEGRETDRAFFLEAWNGYGSFTTDRIGRGTIDTDNLCVSILGGIQPAKLLSYLYQAQSDLKNDGLLQRFQILVYPDEPDNWKLIDERPHAEARNRAFAVYKTLADMDFQKAGATLPDGETIPFFRFSTDAQVVFNEWLTKLQTEKLNSDENPAIVEHMAKYRSLMPSLALVFHLINIADGEPSGPVSLGAAKMAVSWCHYLESHARRIYGMAGSMAVKAAAELSRRIQKGDVNDGFTLRDVYRNCWHILDKKEIVQEACHQLIDAKWLREEELISHGKKRIIYHVNPMAVTEKRQVTD